MIDKRKREYIRFGKIPDNEQSNIYRHGELVGKEIGVSVYDCCYNRGKYCIIYPNPSNEDTICDFSGFMFYTPRSPIYLVTGEEVGIGSDGEPLLKNVKIIKDISNNFELN